MTTIVATLDTIIADRQHSHGGYTATMTKLYTIAKNNYVGMAGDPSYFLLAVEWLRQWYDHLETDGEIPFPERPNISDDFEAMMLTPVGIFLIGPQLAPYLIEDEFYSIGSGSTFALAALQFGKDITNALKFAALNDIYTSVEYDMETIKYE